MKIFTVIVLLVGAGYFIFSSNLSEESHYECNGVSVSEGIERELELFFIITKYDKLVSLWSDRRGHFNYEIPSKAFGYYNTAKWVGEQIQIWDRGSIKGNFSTLSRTIGLDVGAYGYFEGKCNPIDR